MRRLFCAVLLLLGLSPLSEAAISVVQAASNQVTSTSDTVTLTTTLHNALVISVKAGGSSSATFSISDSASQTWTAASCGIVRNGTDAEQLFYVPNSAAVTSVTATWGVSATIAATVYEISGLASSSIEDGCIARTQTSVTTVASGTLSTTNANDILLFGVGVSVSTSSWSAGAGYTLPTGGFINNGRSAIQYKIVSTVQTNVSTSISVNSSANTQTTFIALSDTPVSHKNPAQFPRVIS